MYVVVVAAIVAAASSAQFERQQYYSVWRASAVGGGNARRCGMASYRENYASGQRQREPMLKQDSLTFAVAYCFFVWFGNVILVVLLFVLLTF